MLKKLKKIISCIFVFLTYRICLSVLKCGKTKTQPFKILTNNNALDGFIYRLHRSFLPGKDDLMLIKITGASVKFIGSKYIQESL